MGRIREALAEVRHGKPTSDHGDDLAQGIQQASNEGLLAAYNLIGESLNELQAAITEIQTRGGLLPAAKTAVGGVAGGNEQWASDAGKALVHDGRWPAVDLVTSAEHKYEQAGSREALGQSSRAVPSGRAELSCIL